MLLKHRSKNIIKDQIHVVISVERRRRWSVEEKRSIIQETYLPGMSVSLVTQKYAINPSQFFAWRRHMEEGALEGIRAEERVVSKSQIKELEKRIREHERMLGRKTLENEILREQRAPLLKFSEHLPIFGCGWTSNIISGKKSTTTTKKNPPKNGRKLNKSLLKMFKWNVNWIFRTNSCGGKKRQHLE